MLANGIAPDARTWVTAGAFYDAEAPEGWDPKDPANVSPLVVWLGSDGCDITGRVFECSLRHHRSDRPRACALKLSQPRSRRH